MLLKKKLKKGKLCLGRTKQREREERKRTHVQETVKELTACVYFICAIWSPELCTSESHTPPCACTSFALFGRRLSKNRTPATISIWLLHAPSRKPPDASRGESQPRGAMKGKPPEQRRESRRGRRRCGFAGFE